MLNDANCSFRMPCVKAGKKAFALALESGYCFQMSKAFSPIRMLPTALRNQIAAGEVVERPASVLKELVENSLDAGATDIAVTLEDGGQALIAVRDNGWGIPPADLELAVTRHATSKVASFADLLSVASYGFRGEALPSIASVSDMLVESAFFPQGGAREAGAVPESAFIRVRHGEISERGPSALHQGTLIEVRDLFANVPARLKFLRKAPREQKLCQDALVRLALVRTDVAFTLQTGSPQGARRDLLRLAAGASLKERLARVWPAAAVEEMTPFAGERDGVRVTGLASLPQRSQTKGDRVLLYVNNRPVNNRALFQAVRQAYKNLITTSEYPQAVLFLELDPREVDMNVHPAKSEVRFRDEGAMFSAVAESIRSALLSGSPMSFVPAALEREGTPSLSGHAAAQAELPPLHAYGASPQEGIEGQPSRPPRPEGFWGAMDTPRLLDFPRRESGTETLWTPGDGSAENLHAGEEFFDRVTGLPREPDGLSPEARSRVLRENVAVYGRPDGGFMWPEPPAGNAGDSHGGTVNTDVPESDDKTPGGFQDAWGGAELPVTGEARGGFPVAVGPLLCLGQVADTYLILVRGDTLLLLDQHAAHERVLLHQIERQTGQGESQLLALSVELPLHPAESLRLQEMFPQLNRLGYSLTAGAGSVSIAGVPPLLGRTRGIDLLRDILAERTDGMSDLLHLMACHSAIKAGQRLTADEAAGLLRQWMDTPDCQFCPHGRPTVLAFDPAALEKMFKRKIG